MSDWTEGYVADIGYTYGYYTELNPQRAKLAFLNAGLVCPSFGTACELGFGQGLSVNIHAAASGTAWYGTDFNPAQAGFAQELASISGAAAKLYDEPFAEFASRGDLPDFDYIGLHGIWSWISPENRAVIVDFVRRKLKVGGVLYISYNTMPGWSIFAPMRHLMVEHSRSMGPEALGIVKRVDSAIAFGEKLIETKPVIAVANPQLAPRLEKLKSMSRHYLAHEYFNGHWCPMYFSEMAAALDEAKLTYACSARLLDHVDATNLSPEQQKFLQEIPNPQFRELVRDYITNQQFRTDYWVKGARPIDRHEKEKALGGIRVMLTTAREKVSLKISSRLGDLNLREGIYNPVLDVLADYKPHSFAELARVLGNKGITATHLYEIFMVLCGSGYAAVVQDEAMAGKAREPASKLNANLLKKVLGSDEVEFLASPVTGGGVQVGRFHQLFLRARLEGLKTPVQWAAFTWSHLDALGQKIVKEGKTLATAAENQAELTTQANTFEREVLPVLIGLGIA
jgi:SAM-dependent methyltransferase